MSTVILWDNAAGKVESIVFDVVDQEGHEAMVDVTEFPVEEGSAISDHARPANPRIQIQGFVSLKPMWSNPGVRDLARFGRVDLLGVLEAESSGTRAVPVTYPEDPPVSISLNGLTKAIQRAIRPRPRSYQGREPRRFTERARSVQALAFDTFTNRCRLIAEKLEEIRLGSHRVSVHTMLRDYESMVIEREAEPRTPADGGGVVFQIDLRQIRTVNSETVDAPRPAELRGAARASKGSKAGEKDPNGEAKKEKAQSILKGMKNGAAGALGFGG